MGLRFPRLCGEPEERLLEEDEDDDEDERRC